MTPEQEPVSPEALAATLSTVAAEKDATAATMEAEDRCAWYRGCAAGLADASGRILHDLAPAWKALTTERDGYRDAFRDAVEATADGDDQRKPAKAIAMLGRRLDGARAQRDEARAQHAAVVTEAGQLTVDLATARLRLEGAHAANRALKEQLTDAKVGLAESTAAARAGREVKAAHDRYREALKLIERDSTDLGARQHARDALEATDGHA